MSRMIRSSREFGTFIHNERVKRNLTQKGLADLAGTGQKTVSRIENGHDGTKMETIFSLIAALDLDLQLAPRSKDSADLGSIF